MCSIKPEYHYKKNNEKLRVKKVFKLIPVAILNTQENTIPPNLTKQDIEIGSQLMNRTSKDKKVSSGLVFSYLDNKYKNIELIDVFIFLWFYVL